MSKILLTGASGFLGSYLLPKLLVENKVYALYQSKPPKLSHPNLVPVKGSLELSFLLSIGEVDQVYHLAGVINLSNSKRAYDECFRVNYEGTISVLNYMLHYGVRKLKYTSTAYLKGRNPYEKSKLLAEKAINDNQYVEPTIFRPSIVIGESRAGVIPKGVKLGAFYQFVEVIARIHSRGEKLRRRGERTLWLPPLESIFHIKGNPNGSLNIVPVDIVAEVMIEIGNRGIYHLTNPDPPTLGQLAEWVGEVLGVRVVVEPNPHLSAPEALLARVTRDFTPYLEGDDFLSDIGCPKIDREFIHRSLKTLGY